MNDPMSMHGRGRIRQAQARGFVVGTVLGMSLLILTAFWIGAIGRAPDNTHAEEVTPQPPPTIKSGPPSLDRMLARHLEGLSAEKLSAGDQAVLVEALDGEVLMAHNADLPLNPASVLKLATTLAALEKFGPAHRFETLVMASGPVRGGVLEGDLCIQSDGDPTLGRAVLNEIVGAIHARGIHRIDGALLVAGPFTFVTTDETPEAASRFRDGLVRAGISVSGPARLTDGVAGAPVFEARSEPLIEILQRQNAHSVNRLADNLGTAVGGARGLTAFLQAKYGVSTGEVAINYPSGLNENRMTARAAMRVLRAMVEAAAHHCLSIDELMPLNGVDGGTMRTRLTREGMAASIVAKTGTQSNIDGGVAALAGVAYTRERGPVLFVILNTRGDVYYYRDWQDALLMDAIAALGGPQPVDRSNDTVPVGPETHETLALGDPVLPAFVRREYDR
jgi:D-alanyl-D-alanine carboxypeptidase/D-alanyl-D-alanine-endopeptidase (penicillin-binding protein 4)